MRHIYKALLSLLITLSFAWVPLKVSALESPSIASVVSGNLPKVGTDAYWVINPSNPEQKILLVPSMHVLNLKAVDPKLVEAIKAADILIEETVESKTAQSWDDETMIQYSLDPVLGRLMTFNLIRAEPFLYQGQPWTEKLSQPARDYLMTHFEPVLNPLLPEFKKLHQDQSSAILQKFPLDNLHPLLVASILREVSQHKLYNLGMDRQILRDFDLKGKAIFGLETRAERGESLTDITLLKLASVPTDQASIYTAIEKFVEEMKKINETSPLDFRKEVLSKRDEFMRLFLLQGVPHNPSIVKRNALWIPKLVKDINDHKNKTIVVLVGASHFNGPQGILKLLENQNFTFKPF